MKNFCLVAAMAASMAWIGLAGKPAAAQAPAGRMPGMASVALVDVNYIFKKHARFKAQMEEMKADVERAQAEWKRQGDTLNKQVERLQEYRPGTPEYKQMEVDLVNQRSKLSGQIALEKKEFVQREAKIYYNVYLEIMQEVQYYCSANNIALVLNFNGDQINAENPDDILRGINSKVVYYSKELDITPVVLKRVGNAPSASKFNGPVNMNWPQK